MLLYCAGCGEEVSEWAARCPACLHGTDDAREADPAPSTGAIASDDVGSVPDWTPAVPSSPMDKDEPPTFPDRSLNRVGRAWGHDRRLNGLLPRRRRPFVVLASLLAIAVAILIVAIPSPHERGPNDSGVPAAAKELTGRVVAESDDGSVLLSRPDGRNSTVLQAGRYQPGDRPLLVDQARVLIALRDGSSNASSPHVDALDLPLPATSSPVADNPFSNGKTAVVVMTNEAGVGSTSPVSVVSLSDGDASSLGVANDAAGDPVAAGAFVTVASTHQPRTDPLGASNAITDARVELRDRGSSPVVLATATQLNRDVSQSPTEPVNLTVFPDRDGQKVAVMLNRLDVGASNSAMVILARDGVVLGAVPSDVGPAAYSPPYWSPDDTSLVYGTFSSTGTSLAIVNDMYKVAEQSLEPATRIDGCTWSPDSAWALCLAATSSSQNWLLADNDDTLSPVFSLLARASPAAWLP
jgi:hypothetical protein